MIGKIVDCYIYTHLYRTLVRKKGYDANFDVKLEEPTYLPSSPHQKEKKQKKNH